MENYTITKEQILEIYSYTSFHNQQQLEEWFPEVFKKELEVGVWYKLQDEHFNWLMNYQGEGMSCYGFNTSKEYSENYTMDYDGDEWKEATDEEVKEALEKEVIKRFGKDWKTAKIEKCLIHSGTHSDFEPVVTTDEIWNENGCIYKDGVFTEPLKTKVISLEKAEKILSKKYGQKVEIK